MLTKKIKSGFKTSFIFYPVNTQYDAKRAHLLLEGVSVSEFVRRPIALVIVHGGSGHPAPPLGSAHVHAPLMEIH